MNAVFYYTPHEVKNIKWDMKKILVTGKNGQVGHALVELLPPRVELHAVDSQAFDLTNEMQVRQLIQSVRPHVIINAAAFTAVDQAEREEAGAYAVNARGPQIIGQEAAKIGAVVVHFSTDYVFDGKKKTPYLETDKTNPLSNYGASKLQGEKLLLEACPESVVLRTSWVVSSHGANFAKTMLRLAAEKDQLSVVADQFGAPTPAKLLAQVVSVVLDQLEAQGTANFPYGCYHVAPSGETNWCDYARFVIGEAIKLGADLKVTPAQVHPIKTADYPTAAKRPKNSRLNTTLFQKTFGMPMPTWQSGIIEIVQALYQEH